MKNLIISFAFVAVLCLIEVNAQLIIDTTKQVECTRKSKDGDSLRIHYTVNLMRNFVCETIEEIFVLFSGNFSGWNRIR